MTKNVKALVESYYKSKTLEFTARNSRPSIVPTCGFFGILLSSIIVLIQCFELGLVLLVFSVTTVILLALLRLQKFIVKGKLLKHQYSCKTLVLFNCYCRHMYFSESILLIATFGVQLSQTTVLGTTTGIKFIPIANIKSVVINETIQMVRALKSSESKIRQAEILIKCYY